MISAFIKNLLLFLVILVVPVAGESGGGEFLTDKLENTDKAQVRIFKLRDQAGRGMDCLEVFQPNNKHKEGYYGISHSLRNGTFAIHLSHSVDFENWRHLKELDQHASQATIHETSDGSYLLAYEKDAPNSCWIRIRVYQDLNDLKSGKFSREIDIPRTLAPTAEGTPSFEDVKISSKDFSKSEIKLRFHYFQNARVDQLAHGTLTDFNGWKAAPSKKLNAAIKELGGNGNLGDRSKFPWKGRTYYLQEVQGTRLDWGSWGIFLCDQNGLPLGKIRPRTPKQSSAFSNPAISRVKDANGNSLLVFTAFLHSKGSAPNEAGQMLTVMAEK
ncbi:MAG: hypothetical protein ACI8XO_001570 [Verrucomicrobiales bacterium]|jgi:hypothetical protein